MENSVTPPKCPGCQQPLAPGRAQGLCPRCLLARAALATETAGDPPSIAVPELSAVAAAFPQLEVLEFIGRGGMGVVYKARQKSLNRLVALKLLAPERVTDPQFAGRFEREAQALAQLSHPNIVTIHDFGVAAPPRTPEANAQPAFYFLLMEFVDGVNLRQAMQAGRFTPEQALAIVPPVCGALQFAHERGIVHRDIKPENLLLDKEGRIKIADFGIAKMLGVADGRRRGDESPTAARELAGEGKMDQSLLASAPTQVTAAGTPHYMAPEQRERAGQADHRADIYSLGVVLYELLTGELPGARLEPPSHKVQLDVRLDEIVLRALAVQPELRFATAAEFRTQLDTVATTLHHGPGAAPRPESIPRLLKSASGLLTTPENLTTLEGQFFIRRARGQLLLDEHRLTHACDRGTTVIPLASIRDVSIGQYPATMNPAGIDLLSVTYEDQGGLKQVYVSPMDGWFALPSTWNARVADWHAALRNAVTRATGKEPAETPRGQVAVPKGHGGIKAFMMVAYAVPMLTVFLLLTLTRGTPGTHNPALAALLVLAMLGGGYFGQRLVWRFFQGTEPAAASASSPWSRVIGTLLLLGGLLLGGGLIASRKAQAHAEAQGTAVKLQGATEQTANLRAQLAEWNRRTANSQDETQQSRDQIGRSRLQRELAATTQRSQELERTLAKGVPKPDPSGALLAAFPLVLGGLWLLLRRGAAASPDTKPRRWMQWLGGGCLLLGLPLGGFGAWIAVQIAQDSSWNPAPAEAFVTFAVWLGSAVLVVGGLVLLAFARSAGGHRGGAGTLPIALLAALVSGALVLTTLSPRGIRRFALPVAPRITAFSTEPVRVDDNVIIMNLRTTVTDGAAELHVTLTGPPPSGKALAELAVRRPGLPATLVRSGEPTGNRPRQQLAEGSTVWQVGFLFPTAAAAEETFRGLSAQELGELEPGTLDLFETIASDGNRYRAELRIGSPAPHDPQWVSMAGTSSRTASSVSLAWEATVGSTGLLHCLFGTNASTVPLVTPSPARGHQVRLELTRLDGDRSRLEVLLPSATATQEIPGDFETLANELLGSAYFSLKGTRGEEFELCRFNGEPLTVQLLQNPTTMSGRPKLAVMPLLLLLPVGLAALTVVAVVLAVRRRWGGVMAVVLLVVAGVMFLGIVLTTAFYVRAGVRALPGSPAVVPSEVRP